VLSPMERVRSVYPNALHVERVQMIPAEQADKQHLKKRSQMGDFERFESFYKEVKGIAPSEETAHIFKEVLDEWLREENETNTQSAR